MFHLFPSFSRFSAKRPSLETGALIFQGPVFSSVTQGGGRVMCHRCGACNANARCVASSGWLVLGRWNKLLRGGFQGFNMCYIIYIYVCVTPS